MLPVAQPLPAGGSDSELAASLLRAWRTTQLGRSPQRDLSGQSESSASALPPPYVSRGEALGGFVGRAEAERVPVAAMPPPPSVGDDTVAYVGAACRSMHEYVSGEMARLSDLVRAHSPRRSPVRSRSPRRYLLPHTAAFAASVSGLPHTSERECIAATRKVTSPVWEEGKGPGAGSARVWGMVHQQLADEGVEQLQVDSNVDDITTLTETSLPEWDGDDAPPAPQGPAAGLVPPRQRLVKALGSVEFAADALPAAEALFGSEGPEAVAGVLARFAPSVPHDELCLRWRSIVMAYSSKACKFDDTQPRPDREVSPFGASSDVEESLPPTPTAGQIAASASPRAAQSNLVSVVAIPPPESMPPQVRTQAAAPQPATSAAPPLSLLPPPVRPAAERHFAAPAPAATRTAALQDVLDFMSQPLSPRTLAAVRSLQQ